MATARTPAREPTVRDVLSGRRGCTLGLLLLLELGAAFQGLAFATVLPLVAKDLDGATLYGPTLAAGTYASIAVLAIGSARLGTLDPRRSLLAATVLTVAGALLTVTATRMEMVLTGSILRGAAGGIVAGFALGAIAAMYDERMRPRVLGLFAIVWLLPSLVGPALNAAITLGVGWRIAMAWPAALVVLGRVLLHRRIADIPWEPTAAPSLRTGPGATLVAALTIAALSPRLTAWPGLVVLIGALVAAVVITGRLLHDLLGADGPRRAMGLTMLGLTAAFFGGHQLVSLAVLTGLGGGVLGAAVASGVAQTLWSVTGFRPGRRTSPLGDRVLIGLAVLSCSLALVAVTLLSGLDAHVAEATVGVVWAVAGLGMGLAYPHVSAGTMTGLSGAAATRGGVAPVLAETVGITIGGLLGGNLYALGHASGAPANRSIALAFGAMAAIGVLTAVKVRGSTVRRATATR